MTTAAAPSRASSRVPTLLDELRLREPRLARFGLTALLCSIVAFTAAAIDPRLFAGVSVWLKPAKFFLSIAIFALTWCWFAGLVDASSRATHSLRVASWTLIVSASFELVYITLQAARGAASHFNTGDPLHAILYALMGLGAVALIGTNVPLALAIASRPAPGVDTYYRYAVVTGLVMTVILGGVLGGYMSAQTSHAVGAESAHLPLLGWNRGGGDLRVAHLFGLHAEQAIPMLMLAAITLGVRRKRIVLWGIALAWTAMTLLAFAQALAGRPFPLG